MNNSMNRNGESIRQCSVMQEFDSCAPVIFCINSRVTSLHKIAHFIVWIAIFTLEFVQVDILIRINDRFTKISLSITVHVRNFKLIDNSD